MTWNEFDSDDVLAGVRGANQTYSCNTQVSSGTSMATPIAAGAAILARHYLENATFWGKYCDTTYRSCPSVVRSGYQHVSGALIKAVLVRT
jgi:subtilase family serine protease